MSLRKKTRNRPVSKKSKKIGFSKPRGMRDLRDENFFLYQGFFEKASEIAGYYGFRPIETPVIENEEIYIRTSGESSDIVEKEMYSLKTKGGNKFALRPEYTAGVMRAYIEHGMQSKPQPVMLYSFGPVYRHDRPQKGRHRDPRQFNLEIIGTDKSVTDAMCMHVAKIILKEVGLENIVFSVNSMGDQESRANYLRELSGYYKKHLSTINKNCADCAKRFKINSLRLLDCKNDSCIELKSQAPDTMAFLTENSKRHFKEVLEYMESLEIPYTIDGHLVRGLDYYSQTVFEIFHEEVIEETAPKEDDGDNQKEEEKEGEQVKILAIGAGGRYDYLAKEIGAKKEISAVGVALGVDRIIETASYNKPLPRILKKPKVYFIQLGYDAKLKSLSVIEALRQLKIPVKLSPSKDSLSGQLGTAERLGVPYALILGQREVLEQTIILRNMKNRSQKTLPLDKIHLELKKLK